ncbi:MAG: NAD-dependent DNA ligase LigA [Clostridiales bacterium]|nr:NAD-dependent DNA ligase LigA [Clostridiales bacterium]
MPEIPPLERMKSLIKTLDDASRAYYQENREVISNYEYDALYDELEKLERETGVKLSNSPTGKVGYEVVGSLVKVPHETPMLSLDKTKEAARLVAFLGEQPGVLSWKLDGLTVVLKYSGGQLTQAVTRGNGVIGEDVTHTARVFSNLPLTVPFKGAFTVRGEAVIGNKDFERINESISEAADKYKNPRNLCSGTVRQLNSEVAASRHVRFYAFGLVGAINIADGNDSKSARFRWLSAQGFDVVEHVSAVASNVTEKAEDFHRRAASQDVASDGLVLTYDDAAYGESLGATAKFPRDSIAFKWEDEIRETVFERVEWNTSRTGLINPVAVFEPVELEGTSVSRASLHNVSVMRALELGRGDTVTVYKANMIIPQLADNLTRSNTETVPSRCPVCESETEVTALREGEALYCLNPHCKAQLISGLVHFTGRDAMNIEGLSEQTLEKFAERGMVADYTDIFLLENFKDEIIKMEGFGEKSCAKLIAAIEKAKDAPLPNFIYALGIRHVGLSNAKLLSKHFGYDMEKIIAACGDTAGKDREPSPSEGSENELLEIKGFGEAIAHSLRVYFSNEANMKLLRKAVGFLRIQQPQAEPAGNRALDGLTFVITGETEKFENRKALQNFIEARGGRATGSVTAKTSFLINNDAGSASSKNKKAAELGVPVLTEEMFLEKFK